MLVLQLLKHFAAINNKVNEWKERKEAILRGEAPPSEFVQTDATVEDIYRVEQNEVSPQKLGDSVNQLPLFVGKLQQNEQIL